LLKITHRAVSSNSSAAKRPNYEANSFSRQTFLENFFKTFFFIDPDNSGSAEEVRILHTPLLSTFLT
jgi:hypothetical protein